MSSRPLLKKVIIQKRIRSSDFLKFLSPRERRALLKRAASLQGRRVVHISATSLGGGVAEIMQSLISYLRSLGIESDWYVIRPDVEGSFFSITNKIHDALQGASAPIDRRMWATYKQISMRIAAELDAIDCDILAINDPQPLMAGYRVSASKHKIYFSHIDTSLANKRVWKKLSALMASYDRIVFSNTDFVNPGLPRPKVRVFTPAIDPLASKQHSVSRKEARRYLEKEGRIPTGGPLIVQVSRFDVWKNPLGVVRAFKTVQQVYPEARLALIGFNEAKDNPSAVAVYEKVKAAVGSPGVSLFFDPRGVRISEFTMMAQNAADVVVQNSIKEGFGLVVTEAMWKRQPVVGGPASGIRAQIQNGENGFITKDSDELAGRIIFLLSHPKDRKRLGNAAKKTVLQEFLFPRFIADHLKLYQECL